MLTQGHQPEELAVSTEQTLHSMVEKFSAEPSRYGKLMRDLLRTDYESFPAAAVNILRKHGDLGGCRYLIALLWTNELLIPILGDFTLPKELSLHIGQVAAKVDTNLHIRLTRLLVTDMLEGRQREEQSINRLLEVLGAVTDGFGIQAFIRQMLRHSNPRIRSKVTLLVGNGGNGIRAIEKLITDVEEDARVRANAIEALWQCRHTDAARLYLHCLADPDNRVAGNAALGLYLAGHTTSISAIRAMAASSDRRFQETAVWIIGKTGDPRFLPLLISLIAESSGGLRKSIFRSVAALKVAAAKRAGGLPLSIEVLDFGVGASGKTRLRVALAPSPGSAAPHVPATGFALLSAGKPLDDYTCVEHRDDHLWTAFILPRRPTPDPMRDLLRDSLTACLHDKCASERWGIVRYREASGAAMDQFRLFGHTVAEMQVTPGEQPVNFTGNVAALRADIESHCVRQERDWNPFEAIRHVVAGAGATRYARSAIVVVDGPQELDSAALEDLIRLVRKSNFVIHGLATCENDDLARLSSETNGIFHIVSDTDRIASELQLFYRALKHHYAIEFQDPEPYLNNPLVLRAFTDAASGEVRLNTAELYPALSSTILVAASPMSMEGLADSAEAGPT